MIYMIDTDDDIDTNYSAIIMKCSIHIDVWMDEVAVQGRACVCVGEVVQCMNYVSDLGGGGGVSWVSSRSKMVGS